MYKESTSSNQPSNVESRLTHTTSRATVTHTIINDEVCAVWDMPAKYGCTYEERRTTLDYNTAIQTHCVIGKTALTLNQFEEAYPHIQLAYE